MWYFAWILGTGFAAMAAVLNGMWFEAREPAQPTAEKGQGDSSGLADQQ